MIVQGATVPAGMVSRAHVVFPSTVAAERDGTYTNAERRIQRVRAFLPAPGETLPVWRVPAAIGQALGMAGFDHGSTEAVFDEIARVVPQYGGLSFGALDDRITGPTWPTPASAGSDDGVAVLYASGIFAREGGRARVALSI